MLLGAFRALGSLDLVSLESGNLRSFGAHLPPDLLTDPFPVSLINRKKKSTSSEASTFPTTKRALNQSLEPEL